MDDPLHEFNLFFQVILSGGPTPTHLEFDSKRNILYVANYGVNSGGSFSAFKIDSKDGTILENIYNEAYGAGSNVVPDRQKDSHPHAGSLTFARN